MAAAVGPVSSPMSWRERRRSAHDPLVDRRVGRIVRLLTMLLLVVATTVACGGDDGQSDQEARLSEVKAQVAQLRLEVQTLRREVDNLRSGATTNTTSSTLTIVIGRSVLQTIH